MKDKKGGMKHKSYTEGKAYGIEEQKVNNN
jgi:hypothetical protein